LKPSVIIYRTEKSSKIGITPIKYSDEEVTSWWRVMRPRISNLALVMPVTDFNEAMKDPGYADWINGKRDSPPPYNPDKEAC